MRQIILDTETTGLEPSQGHRIIEIGCVELVKRRLTGVHYHQYLQPDREIDDGALEVHGISNEFLADKPRFQDVAAEFLAFIGGAELIIHNAPFDIGFLDAELRRLGLPPVTKHCGSVTDTLLLARQLHPGQRNSLDALCKRYSIDNSQRTLHGALLDAEILADLYLVMTGGQRDLGLGERTAQVERNVEAVMRLQRSAEAALPVLAAATDEVEAHQRWLERLAKSGRCVWRDIEPTH
ncbi:MAG: DNA polymerase III subunit epsilon [Gammaproteobacteria bacterium]|nr:DNA polymerase III subunit epsilon [Gammaproteobacteria bacterium]